MIKILNHPDLRDGAYVYVKPEEFESLSQRAITLGLPIEDLLTRLLFPEKTSKELSTRTAALNSRQREIAALVAKGMNNKEIGEKYGISENTVKHHLKKALKALGLSSRLELIALYASSYVSPVQTMTAAQ